MKPPVSLFEKNSMKLYVLKAKSQAKDYQQSCMLLA